ncbi:leucine-rich repeat domain-containing protein [Pseudomonas simiae]|uniref:leucine-rich repeat domain-containing protein n=1 Tax=Pseudomonas simiae TaxID=321846 RepID=UPI0019677B02|nr:leucine-rich repeat domain-containing protein [Pseudomonas simiae]QRR30749.1 leucine-rich repeat domain-containing protein [Pseudomonas simiae]
MTSPIQLPDVSAYRDLHQDILMQAVPAWLPTLSPAKRTALNNVKPSIPQWYKTASPDAHDTLKNRVSRAWEAQSKVDQAMGTLKSPQAFGAPLLAQLLKRRFGIERDVETTYLRLYIPLTIPWFSVRSGAARTWTVSLLDAALHNFEAGEVFEASSGFITKPTSTGQFDTLPALDTRITVAQFTALCRELDIGAKYQRYLEQFFDFNNPLALASLQLKLKHSQAADLNVALQMAWMKGDLHDDQSVTRLQRLLNTDDNPNTCYPLQCYNLSIMSTALTGIVLFAENIGSRHPVGVIAYIPDDPYAPLKQYPTLVDFMTALGNNLRSAEYQQFFSRFISHEERGLFFADLNRRLSKVTWHPHTRGDPLPSWRETPIDQPHLAFRATAISGDLFTHLFQTKLSKVFSDARAIAVSTASVDQRVRWERWAIVQKVASAILQIAAFIVAPFVPPVGLLMLGYSAYQMLDEAFEWVIDWAVGDVTEAFAHLLSFVEQGIQLGLFIAGAPIAASALRTLLPADAIKFFDSFKPVALPNGKTRLWKPDLAPYAHDLRLASHSYPNAQGLHAYNGKNILLLADKPFMVETDPITQQRYLQHPTRSNAYRPPLLSNDKGAWLNELDTPLSWDSTTLMKRQGPRTAGLSDEQLVAARRISGTREGALRKMYVNQHQPPPLLTDTVDRFRIDQALQDFIDQMNSDDPAIYRRADAQSQLHLLANLELWPKAKTLRFLDSNGRTAWELPGEKNASVVQIHEAQLKQDVVLETLLEALDEPQRKTLLGEAFGDPVTSLKNRALKLRKQLAGRAQSHRAELFDTRYQQLERPITPRQRAMIDNTPGLPLTAADALLDTANSQELKAVDEGKIPVRLSELAQSLRDEARVNHAYDGLYLDSTETLDTHRLALHSLEKLPGWAGKKLRIEIRSSTPEAALLDAIGKPKARIKRTLVRSPDGRYTPQDDSGELSGATDLYNAVLQALPDAERNALGLHIGQGPALRLALRTHALKRAPLRTLITAEPARAPTDTRTHLRLLGMDNYPPAPAEQPDLQALARELYPAHTDEQIGEMIQTLERRPGGAFATLTALRQEFQHLNRALADWAARPPHSYPGTEVSMGRQEYSDMRQNRILFWRELLRAWRRETETDTYFEHPSQNGQTLKSHAILYGELPALPANFEHISYLELSGNQSALTNIDVFLRSFPNIRHLSITHAQLGQLPATLSAMPRLNTLILSNCGITLTPDSLNTLTAMNRLRTLDLYSNPLGLSPSVERMIDLRALDLSETGISNLPAGLLSRASLELAVLSRNRITQLPSALFDLPADTSATFDLSGNPLSRATLEQVKSYYQRTGRYWEVDALAIDIQRVNTLFPDFSVNEVNRFLFGLPGTIEIGQIELARLEVEYANLSDGLDTWARQAPVPEEQARRVEFKEELQACWRREGALDTSSPQAISTFTVESPQPVTGTFPSLDSGVFRHVSSLHLKGAQGPFPLQSPLFFRGFPTLNHLFIEGYVMGDIPASVWDLPQLSSLRLPRCALTLSTESAASLTTLSELATLDLSHNTALGQLPDFSALPRLTSIELEDTGLTAIPDGLLKAVERQRVNLSNNLITQIPDSAFRLPDSVTAVFDLSRNPLNRSGLMQIKRHCQRTGEHWRVDAPTTSRERIKALYPTFTEHEASRFFFELPGDLDAAEPAIEQLETEYAQLRTDLEEWVVNVPERHPVVDTPLDEQTRAQDQLNRRAFKTLLEAAWRRESELDDNNDDVRPTHKLTFEMPILGELPELSARFDHVTTLDLEGNGTTTRIDGLLKCFPKLRSLVITRFSLGEIPPTALSLPALNALSLTESAIRLTPTSVHALSWMSRLEYLDLGGNRLGLTPDVSQLTELETLYLPDTDITHLPQGLFALHELRSLDLSDNLIEEIPADFLQLATQLDTDSDISGNPLSASSLDTLRHYYLLTGDDLAVAAAGLDENGSPLVRPRSPEPMEE